MPLETLPQQDFHVPRGNYYEVNIDIDSDDPNNPGTLAGLTLTFKASKFTFLNPDPANVLITKTNSGGGVDVVSESLMTVKVILQGADTSSLEPGIYYWQLDTTTGGGAVSTVSRGRLFVDQTV